MSGPFIRKSTNPAYHSVFAETVHRSPLSHASRELAGVLDSIDAFLAMGPDFSAGFHMPDEDPTALAAALHRIHDQFNTWRLLDPKEFADRFSANADAFSSELQGLMARSQAPGALFEAQVQADGFGTPPLSAFNPHAGRMAQIAARSQGQHFGRMADHKLKAPGDFHSHLGEAPASSLKQARKKLVTGAKEHGPDLVDSALMATEIAGAFGSLSEGAKFGLGLLSGPGGSVAQVATPGLTVVTAALPAGALLLNAVNAGVAVRSSMRTHRHLHDLRAVRAQADRLACHGFSLAALTTPDAILPPPDAFNASVHKLIRDHILDYIIEQKETKETRKIGQAVSMGLPLSLWSSGKAVFKHLTKTKGVKRYKAAHWLAHHFCTCHCQLAMHIVAALTSAEEMYWLLDKGDYEAIADVLAEKMKSS
jgi:hypothetical protein